MSGIRRPLHQRYQSAHRQCLRPSSSHSTDQILKRTPALASDLSLQSLLYYLYYVLKTMSTLDRLSPHIPLISYLRARTLRTRGRMDSLASFTPPIDHNNPVAQSQRRLEQRMKFPKLRHLWRMRPSRRGSLYRKSAWLFGSATIKRLSLSYRMTNLSQWKKRSRYQLRIQLPRCAASKRDQIRLYHAKRTPIHLNQP